jgi:hypothetical protein
VIITERKLSIINLHRGLTGSLDQICGDAGGIWGEVSPGLSGDVSSIRGEITGIVGDATNCQPDSVDNLIAAGILHRL